MGAWGERRGGMQRRGVWRFMFAESPLMECLPRSLSATEHGAGPGPPRQYRRYGSNPTKQYKRYGRGPAKQCRWWAPRADPTPERI